MPGRCTCVQSNALQVCVFQIPQTSCACCRGQGMAFAFPGPATCGALGSLAQAVSGGTMPWCHHLVSFSVQLFVGTSSMPGLCPTPSSSVSANPLPIPSAPLRGWRWPRAPPLLLCPWMLDVGAELPFSFFGSPSHKRQRFSSPSTLFINRLWVLDTSCPQDAWKKKNGNYRRKAALDSSHGDWDQESASISKEFCSHEQLRSAQRAHLIPQVFVPWLLILYISSLNKVLHLATQVSSSTLARGCTCRWNQPEMPLLDTLGSSKAAENSDYSE